MKNGYLNCGCLYEHDSQVKESTHHGLKFLKCTKCGKTISNITGSGTPKYRVLATKAEADKDRAEEFANAEEKLVKSIFGQDYDLIFKF